MTTLRSTIECISQPARRTPSTPNKRTVPVRSPMDIDAQDAPDLPDRTSPARSFMMCAGVVIAAAGLAMSGLVPSASRNVEELNRPGVLDMISSLFTTGDPAAREAVQPPLPPRHVARPGRLAVMVRSSEPMGEEPSAACAPAAQQVFVVLPADIESMVDDAMVGAVLAEVQRATECDTQTKAVPVLPAMELLRCAPSGPAAPSRPIETDRRVKSPTAMNILIDRRRA